MRICTSARTSNVPVSSQPYWLHLVHSSTISSLGLQTTSRAMAWKRTPIPCIAHATPNMATMRPMLIPYLSDSFHSPRNSPMMSCALECIEISRWIRIWIAHSTETKDVQLFCLCWVTCQHAYICLTSFKFCTTSGFCCKAWNVCHKIISGYNQNI